MRSWIAPARDVSWPVARTGRPAPNLGDLLYKLDPNAPFVIDTRELGRRPGSQRTVSRTYPAPADLRIDVIGVPQGSPVGLDVRLEAVMEGVLVTGSATVQLHGECARCLGAIEDITSVDLQELYVYDHVRTDDDEDQETRRLVDDLLDLEPLVRDTVVLALPFKPVCSDSCGGLCPECGARLSDDPDHAHEAPIDPRWAALQGLEADVAGGAHQPVVSGRDDER